MVRSCNGRCFSHYPDRTYVGQFWVEKGYKKCMTCVFHTKTNDIKCKCCNGKFRTTVRQKNHNKKYYIENIQPHNEEARSIIIKWRQNRISDDIK